MLGRFSLCRRKVSLESGCPLVSAQSDLRSTRSAFSGVGGLRKRSLSAGLAAPLGSGALAGLAFALSDVARACVATGWVGATNVLALLGLWLWLGQMVGAAGWLSRRVAVAIQARAPRWVPWRAVLGLAAGIFTLLLARKVFLGPGVRRTLLGSWGVWILAPAVAVTAWVALWIAARLMPGGRRSASRTATAFLAASVSLGAIMLEARAPDGYLYLHVLLLAAALVVATESLALIAPAVQLKHGALALSLVALPSLVTFPASQKARELLEQPAWAGWQLIAYAQLHVDLDRDGHSPWFGGGDCNDTNASVFTGAPEKPGDGHDSDCDGLDDPKLSSLNFAPFRAPSGQLVQELSARAQKFPTVVVLIDALRFDRIGNARFPNLAQLSQEAIQFTRMYAASSSTLTSVPAMVTGSARPPRSRENIAQSLGRAKQVSAFIAPDVIEQTFRIGKDFDPLLGFSSRTIIPTDYGDGWGRGDTLPTSDQVTARAVELVDSNAPPDLIWLHYFDLHQWDILETQGLPAHGDVARYDAVLERIDAALRPLLARREHINLILLADHGEGLGAKGVKHHGGFVFEELTHVPFLLRIPGTKPATIAVPVGTLGMFNTLRVLRGLEPDATVDNGLLELLGGASAGNGPGYVSFEQEQWSLLYGEYRLLYMPRQQLLELYSVGDDLRAQKNLLGSDPQLASQMLTRLFQLHNEPRH